jgi:hypothetical protein
MGMSVKGYARSVGADPKSIRRAIAAGIIRRDADGLIDPDQADSAWASTRRASRLGQHHNGEAGAHAAAAKIAASAAQLQLATAKFNAMNERFFDRGEASRIAGAEAAYALEVLRASPDSAAAEDFAQQLGIDLGTARVILRKFVDATLAEVGDLEAQAVGDAERV